MPDSWEMILKEFEESGEFVELYTSSNEDEFYVASIQEVFDEFEDEDSEIYREASVIVAPVDPDGQADGLLWFPLYDLTKICSGTKYLESRRDLFAAAEAPEFNMVGSDGLDTLLALSKDEGKVLSLDADGELVFGVVTEYNEQFVKMHCYTENGEDNGTAYIDKEQINVCQYQGVDETAVEKLLS